MEILILDHFVKAYKKSSWEGEKTFQWHLGDGLVQDQKEIMYIGFKEILERFL